MHLGIWTGTGLWVRPSLGHYCVVPALLTKAANLHYARYGEQNGGDGSSPHHQLGTQTYFLPAQVQSAPLDGWVCVGVVLCLELLIALLL